MSTILQLESEIQTLPDTEFHSLLAWMETQHLTRLASDGFEAMELEAALLEGGGGAHREWNEDLLDEIKGDWNRTHVTP
jgi:hypothetical protein